MQYACTHDMLVVIEPEDAAFAGDGCIADGRISTRLGLVGIPEVSESIALSRALLLAEETGVKLHVAQISSAKSVALIAQAKALGVKVTCDVAIHHLLLTDADIDDFDSMFHLRPPLRTEKDRAALQAGIESGTIDAIVSQHLPHDVAAKQAPFAESASGSSGLELLLPLALKLVSEGRVSRGAIVRALTTSPAAIMGRSNYGLVEGSDADLCIVDQDSAFTVTPAYFVSQGKNTPYSGHSFTGLVTHTYVSGVQVYPPQS
jgi:dihydroorotase